jgi:hypothetical protein
LDTPLLPTPVVGSRGASLRNRTSPDKGKPPTRQEITMSDTIIPTATNTPVEESIAASRAAALVYLEGAITRLGSVPLDESAPEGLAPAIKWLREALELVPDKWTPHHPLAMIHIAAEDKGCPEINGYTHGQSQSYEASRRLRRHLFRLQSMNPG